MEEAMWKEFKEFAMRGNVIDLAVGIIIGGAFGAIVSSLVNDIIMPIIGRMMGPLNFTDLFINLTPEKQAASLKIAKDLGAATINYGVFINTIINFLIIALVLFFLIKAINKTRKPAPAPAVPDTKECPYCLTMVPKKATRCPACTSDLKK
jgi:large conductance mechanosensitive channel